MAIISLNGNGLSAPIKRRGAEEGGDQILTCAAYEGRTAARETHTDREQRDGRRRFRRTETDERKPGERYLDQTKRLRSKRPCQEAEKGPVTPPLGPYPRKLHPETRRCTRTTDPTRPQKRMRLAVREDGDGPEGTAPSGGNEAEKEECRRVPLRAESKEQNK